MPIFYFVPDQEADALKNPLTAERLLRSLGATGKLAGFRCTVYMIERIKEDPEQLQLITKRLYKETGKRFGSSAASVERNLRTLIHFCWNRTDHSFLEHIAGTPLKNPPTNSEFLDILASYLREMDS
ncbi:sporulation initiation factor Spo0A C-terminal domain-containing protein [Candidatus Pseudoscillospira sp. SGI.172]|uniref:sporulation initiation factor Spo0A C-terminal domain-containing protein n=1 Tax=Candidatus Pseudoscillospira sp. SGI.172 TaxID=3420582 RepID=UPI002A79DF50|nr:sporulation initiation factor Spo0A C-terminal domain-containing protein [Pseudoflavonifractor sp.]MDY3019101.1 sporulation initiation factor Spo0A C-terminal domain-containing protein [Oscillospiraceae bacterium]